MKEQWFVEYLVPSVSGDKVQGSGPYETRDEALAQKADIEGYEGVTEARVIMKVAPDDA